MIVSKLVKDFRAIKNIVTVRKLRLKVILTLIKQFNHGIVPTSYNDISAVSRIIKEKESYHKQA